MASGREYQRALELNPNYTQAHRSYAAYLSAVGKAEEAIREIHLAQDLDPLSLTLSAEIAWHLYMARDYDQAIEQALRTLELEPQNSTAQGVLGTSYAQQAKYGAACAALQAGGSCFQRITRTHWLNWATLWVSRVGRMKPKGSSNS